MRNMIVAAAAAVLLLSPMVVQAQTAAPAAPPPAPPYGLSIGNEATKKALAAAEAEAKKNNWAVAIAVVDTGGKLVGFSRLDNVQNASVDIAIGKAVTANNFKRPTKALQDGIAQGGVNTCASWASPASRRSKAACRSSSTARSSVQSACPV